MKNLKHLFGGVASGLEKEIANRDERLESFNGKVWKDEINYETNNSEDKIEHMVEYNVENKMEHSNVTHPLVIERGLQEHFADVGPTLTIVVGGLNSGNFSDLTIEQLQDLKKSFQDNKQETDMQGRIYADITGKCAPECGEILANYSEGIDKINYLIKAKYALGFE